MSSTMGQALDTSIESRVPYDDESDNGLILGDKYIPEELITEILCYVDHESLLTSQLVCKRWKMLMESYVWRKKAEMAAGCSLHSAKDSHWYMYYVICKKRPFNRNLMKNHSGEEGLKKNWKIIRQGGDHWKVESSPQGVPPLPTDEPVFEGKQFCFVTSYSKCSKSQTIDLESEGLPVALLDTFQPPIVISEWYSCRWDCPATYECSVTLFGLKNKIIKSFEFRRSIENDDQNQWHKVDSTLRYSLRRGDASPLISHEFTNYGEGLRKIRFYHAGIDNLFWAGHYGSKMAGASVIVKVPHVTHHSDLEIE